MVTVERMRGARRRDAKEQQVLVWDGADLRLGKSNPERSSNTCLHFSYLSSFCIPFFPSPPLKDKNNRGFLPVLPLTNLLLKLKQFETIVVSEEKVMRPAVPSSLSTASFSDPVRKGI